MRSFRLAAGFWQVFIAAKLLAIVGAYGYVLLSGRDAYYGPPSVFWGSLGVFIALNLVLFLKRDLPPATQEKQVLASVGADFLAASYLFLLHPPEFKLLLLFLCLMCGLYNFLLPHGSGVLVTSISALLFVFALLTSPLYVDQPALEGRQLAAMILLSGGTLAATMLLSRRIKRAVDDIYEITDDLTLDLTAHVVDSSLNIDQLTRRNQEIATLLTIAENLVSVLEWEDLFKRIVEGFRNRFEFDKFCIYLYDAEEDRLELSVESGGERATGVAKTIQSDQGVVGWCYSHGKGVMINDVTKDERYSRFNERGKRIRSLICQPLIFRGDRLGVVCLDSEKVNVFNDSSFEFLERVAPLISIAVANSLSYSEVKAASNTDNLTGLHNHRGFMDKFLPLLDDSFVDGFPLAVITMDIDNFKSINDTYGHLIGNIILSDLAGILNTFFRASDLVARFGGEEFMVVLNGTPPDIAPRIAEQLRRKVESHQFPITLERDMFKQVTLSIGLATTLDSNVEAQIVSGSRGRSDRDKYLRNAEDVSAKLIDNADQAMYAAKRNGKNQVRLSPHYPIHMEGVKVVLPPAEEAVPLAAPPSNGTQPIAAEPAGITVAREGEPG